MPAHLKMLALILTLCFLASSQAQDSCAMGSFPVQSNFTLTLFMGTWYELSWIPENWFPPEFNFKDFVHVYELHNDTYVQVTATGRERSDSPECFYSEDDGLVVTEEPGKFHYHRLLNQTTGERFKSDYWVIVTDYDNYALVFGCRGWDDADSVCILPDGWVWSRSTSLSDVHQEIINNQIEELCLNSTQFMITEHNNPCPLTISGASSPSISGFLLLVGSLITRALYS